MNEDSIDGSYQIIGDILVLNNEYDTNQYWLPFVIAVVRPTCDTPIFAPLSPFAIQSLNSKKYAEVHRDDRKFYIHKRGVHQHVLPFIEAKQVSDAEWNELIETDFPGWEKLPNKGYVSKLNVPQNKETLEWLMDNCRGRFRYKNKTIRFEFITDYAVACLRFMN